MRVSGQTRGSINSHQLTRVMFCRHVFVALDATDGIVLMYHQNLQTNIERDILDQLGEFIF